MTYFNKPFNTEEQPIEKIDIDYYGQHFVHMLIVQ